jgi:hypothetical protein
MHFVIPKHAESTRGTCCSLQWQRRREAGDGGGEKQIPRRAIARFRMTESEKLTAES